MFPQGAPGLALLLLRISVSAFFLIYAQNLAEHSTLSSINFLVAGALLVSALLGIGFLTPYLSFIVFVCAVANLAIGLRGGHLAEIFHIIDAAALALLGPGAYSLDARLFGRRVTVLPARKSTDRL